MFKMNKRLKLFWKYILTVFLIDVTWFILVFTIGYFTYPNFARHLAGLGFIIIPFIFSYKIMWKEIEELEDYISKTSNTKLGKK